MAKGSVLEVGEANWRRLGMKAEKILICMAICMAKDGVLKCAGGAERSDLRTAIQKALSSLNWLVNSDDVTAICMMKKSWYFESPFAEVVLSRRCWC